MLMKKEGEDFTVAKLEGLWWTESDKPFQVFHIDPYSVEIESIARMEKLIEEQNLIKNGCHHESIW